MTEPARTAVIVFGLFFVGFTWRLGLVTVVFDLIINHISQRIIQIASPDVLLPSRTSPKLSGKWLVESLIDISI